MRPDESRFHFKAREKTFFVIGLGRDTRFPTCGKHARSTLWTSGWTNRLKLGSAREAALDKKLNTARTSSSEISQLLHWAIPFRRERETRTRIGGLRLIRKQPSGSMLAVTAP